MNHKDALSKYKKTQVNTADGGRLVVLLYEAAIKNIDEALAKFNFENYDLVNVKLQKTIDIIDELMVSLNMDAGEIAERLKSLYIYMHERLNEANLKKDPAPLEEVKSILSELLDSWRVIAENNENKTKPNTGYTGGLSISG